MNAEDHPEARLDELMTAIPRAGILRAFVELDLPAALDVENGSSVGALAKSVGALPELLERLLRGASALDLCVEEVGAWRLTASGASLRRGESEDTAGWIMMLTAPWMTLPWASLADAVRTGEPSFPQVHGVGFWEFLAGHPEEARAFDAALATEGTERASDLHRATDLAGAITIVDVGSGHGTLLRELLSRLPEATGVAFDRAEVIRSVPEVVRLADRMEFRAGDFFEEIPRGGDVYVLSRILHDWSDEDAEQILRSCRRSVSSTSRLLLLEQVAREASSLDQSSKLELAMKDLNMLVLVGGKERTVADYQRLLEAAGFLLEHVHIGEACDVLQARPVKGRTQSR